MVDLILAAAIFAAFGGGFWCGSKYRTFAVMFDALLESMKK